MIYTIGNKDYTIKDLHNYIQKLKKQKRDGYTDEELLMNCLNSFISDSSHNSCTVNPTVNGVIDCVSITTKHMKLIFQKFPEIIMVDTTHNTNKNGYELLSIVVHDYNGIVSTYSIHF